MSRIALLTMLYSLETLLKNDQRDGAVTLVNQLIRVAEKEDIDDYE